MLAFSTPRKSAAPPAARPPLAPLGSEAEAGTPQEGEEQKKQEEEGAGGGEERGRTGPEAVEALGVLGTQGH